MLGKQIVAIIVSMAWSGIVTIVLLLILKNFTVMLSPVHGGLDKRYHGEVFAYDIQNENEYTDEEEEEDENKNLTTQN